MRTEATRAARAARDAERECMSDTVNYSCVPSTMVRGRDVVTLRALAPGDELTFDYETTEYDLAEPFTCQCGSAWCVGEVRGFRYLSGRDRQRVGPFAAPHLWQRREHEGCAAIPPRDHGRPTRRSGGVART